MKSAKSRKYANDKYYTSYKDMEYVVKKVDEVIGRGNISEYLEPSAGGGVFVRYLRGRGDKVIALDIDPEGEGIEKGDYLTYPLEYKKGRCIIGNPPYGERMNKAIKFYKRSLCVGDYIAFILPISQLNNTRTLYGFKLEYSEDMGALLFKEKKVKCCLNIYKRVEGGLLKRETEEKVEGIRIYRQDSKKYEEIEGDIRICTWGVKSGKILEESERYSAEVKLVIEDKEKVERIKEIIRGADWVKEMNSVSARRLKNYVIWRVLREGLKVNPDDK